MSNNQYVIKMGTVESVSDDLDGGRIKVRLVEDGDVPPSALPYAMPLNPKMFQCMPKEGECALVICSMLGNGKSQRYYLGPVISQQQENNYGEYKSNRSNAISLFQGAGIGPSKPISNFSVTDGAFPDKNDIALIGRQSEDVILRNGEIDLRCGVRQEVFGDEDEALRGWVAFNAENPAYIQIKHKPHLLNNGDGVVNIVADKINLVSYQDTDNDIQIPLTNPNSKRGDKTDPLLQDKDIEPLMSQLHQVPYGDVLVEILTVMCKAITNHMHKMGTEPPYDKTIENVKALDLNSILSKHIRIS